MTKLLKSASLLILTEKCYDEYFLNLNFLDVPCFKSSLSKGLGIGIIAGSILVKLPQILKIINNKSSKGLNIYSVYLELFAITAAVSYSFVSGFPFSAWGEGTFLGIQTAAIAALVLFFDGHQERAVAFVSAYAAVAAVLVSGLCPLSVLWFFQACNVPIILAGKLVQAITNYKNGSTGQLSAATCFLLFFGSLLRIFTSIQETGDFILVLTYCVASLANSLLVGQLLWYWNAEKVKVTKTKLKKKE